MVFLYKKSTQLAKHANGVHRRKRKRKPLTKLLIERMKSQGVNLARSSRNRGGRSAVCYAHEHRSDEDDDEIRQLNSARYSVDGSWGYPL